jgi:predicted secreted protein
MPGSGRELKVNRTGATLITNGTFATDSVWTKGTGWTITGGAAVKSAGTASVLSQAASVSAGSVYQVVFTVTRSAGTLTPQLTGGTTVSGTAVSASGTYVRFLTAVTGNTTLAFSADSSFAGTVDNVSIRLVTVLAGVRTKTVSIAGAPIDVTNDDDLGFRTLLSNAGTYSLDLSVEGVSKDEALLDVIAAGSGLIFEQMSIQFHDGANIVGDFFLASFEQTGEYADAVTFSASFQSSGAWIYNT